MSDVPGNVCLIFFPSSCNIKHSSSLHMYVRSCIFSISVGLDDKLAAYRMQEIRANPQNCYNRDLVTLRVSGSVSNTDCPGESLFQNVCIYEVGIILPRLHVGSSSGNLSVYLSLTQSTWCSILHRSSPCFANMKELWA